MAGKLGKIQSPLLCRIPVGGSVAQTGKGQKGCHDKIGKNRMSVTDRRKDRSVVQATDGQRCQEYQTDCADNGPDLYQLAGEQEQFHLCQRQCAVGCQPQGAPGKSKQEKEHQRQQKDQSGTEGCGFQQPFPFVAKIIKGVGEVFPENSNGENKIDDVEKSSMMEMVAVSFSEPCRNSSRIKGSVKKASTL